MQTSDLKEKKEVLKTVATYFSVSYPPKPSKVFLKTAVQETRNFFMKPLITTLFNFFKKSFKGRGKLKCKQVSPK